MYAQVSNKAIKPQVSQAVRFYSIRKNSRNGKIAAALSLSVSGLMYGLFRWEIAPMVLTMLTGLVALACWFDNLAHGNYLATAEAPEIYSPSMQKALAEAIEGKINSQGEAPLPFKLSRQVKKIEKDYAKREYMEREANYRAEISASRQASRMSYEQKRQAIIKEAERVR